MTWLQVVLRDGKAIDAEVPDYSELDTVPSEQQYADHAPEVPSILPWVAPETAPPVDSVQSAAASQQSFLTQMAHKGSDAQHQQVR